MMKSRVPRAPRRKRSWWASRPVVGAASLLIGVGVGAASGVDLDVESVPAYVALQERNAQVVHSLTEVSDERDDLAARVAAIEVQLSEQEAVQEELEETLDEVRALESEVAELQSELEVQVAAVEEAEDQLAEIAPLVATSGSGGTGSSSAKSPATSTPPASPKAPATSKPPAKPKAPATSKPPAKPKQTQSPSSVYYKNCTEARAAGVTPIYRGEPGYAPHLDRDKDGIACE